MEFMRMTPEGGGAEGISALSYQAGGGCLEWDAHRRPECERRPYYAMRGGANESAAPGGQSPKDGCAT